MYIWKTSKLIDDLKHNRLTSQNFKNYYIANALIAILGMYAIHLAPRYNSQSILVEMILSIGILISGINALFTANQRNAGHEFLNRIISLMLPITIKVVILSLILYLLVSGYLHYLDGSLTDPALANPALEWLDTAFSVTVQLVLFWRLYIALKKINDPSTSPAV